MQITTAESLIHALGDSRLFTPAEVAALADALAPFGDDPQAMLRFLMQTNRVPVYQLRKVVHGKTADLFIGPYVVLDKLGEGGMGKVFKARDPRADRLVALKVVRPHLLANPVIRGRYDREVQAALILQHPNIASAYEAGDDGGRYYLAMEFVDGIDLARLVRAFGVLPVPEACEYLRQAALGLHHAHTRGFIHRDIKPSNIVVAGERHHPDSTEPARVKLLDMGLVRWVGLEEEAVGTDLTRAGTVVGTPDYMAPEQAKNSSTVDHRADLYNLGGTFYFLLTGQPPFPVGSPVEKILKHQLDPPPPLQAARPDVSDGLARVVARLLAKKPDDRFKSAGELAEALGPFTRFTPSTLTPPPRLRAGGGAADGVSAETLPPPSVTVLPFQSPSSSDDLTVPGVLALLPESAEAPRAKVGPTDRTPRPRESRPPRKSSARTKRSKRSRAAFPRALVWVAVAVALVLAAGAVWLIFGRSW
jgi:serine/threonine-protein kinase